MENQKIIHLLKNTPNQSSKFRAENWVKVMTYVERITPIAKLNFRP